MNVLVLGGDGYLGTKVSDFFADIVLENFYGPDEHRDSFLHNCVCLLKDDKPLELTVGTQHRDFIYVADVIGALFLGFSSQQVSRL